MTERTAIGVSAEYDEAPRPTALLDTLDLGCATFELHASGLYIVTESMGLVGRDRVSGDDLAALKRLINQADQL